MQFVPCRGCSVADDDGVGRGIQQEESCKHSVASIEFLFLVSQSAGLSSKLYETPAPDSTLRQPGGAGTVRQLSSALLGSFVHSGTFDLTMSGREIITLQIGSVANYVGAHYWNLEVCGKPRRTTGQASHSRMTFSTLFSRAHCTLFPSPAPSDFRRVDEQDEYERRYAEGASDEIDAAAASGLETDPSCIFRQGLTYSVRARSRIRFDCPRPFSTSLVSYSSFFGARLGELFSTGQTGHHAAPFEL